MHFLLLTLLALSGTAQAGAGQYFDEHTIRASDVPASAPKFEDFPARHSLHGVLIAPNVHADRRSRLFRTVIREEAKKGPNFAGHYTVVFWGCGAGCASLAIVDGNTGTVYHPNHLRTVDNVNIAFEELEPPDGRLVKFRIESQLLVVIGGINEDPTLRGILYFLWEHGRLRRLRFVHRPYR